MSDKKIREKLEARRIDALLAIRGEQQSVETMAERPRPVEDTLDTAFVNKVLERIGQIEESAKQATNINEFDYLVEDAEEQGQLRAYICPLAEIPDEGRMAIDLIEEWNVPKTVITKLRASLGQKVEKAETQPDAARSALRAIFAEYDSWASYTDDYEGTMRRFTRWLFGTVVVVTIVAIVCFNFSLTVLGGLLFAGAAGSCASVMAKMPVLDVSLSWELDSYGRRILTRIGVGVIGSMIGCALLGWGLFPISIQNQTFADVLSACATSPAASCNGIKPLVLLGVPMLFGFSERALTSFEQRIFGNSEGTRSKSR